MEIHFGEAELKNAVFTFGLSLLLHFEFIPLSPHAPILLPRPHPLRGRACLSKPGAQRNRKHVTLKDRPSRREKL